MKTASDPWPTGEWRRRLADAVSDIDELAELLDLDVEGLGAGATPDAARRFPLRVPRGFVDRMRPGDPHDPLLRQVLPLPLEDGEVSGFTADPVGELGIVRGDGLLRKYHGRALVVATGACAVHCRYCFRRHFPYDGASGGDPRLEKALTAVGDDPSIDEVILSGGDPLMLADSRLSEIARRVASLPRVRRLRIHTRLPVVLPERVDEGLIDWIASSPIPVVVVIHTNHPNEIAPDVERAMTTLSAAGAMLLNQSVLLAGVNDSAEQLAELSQRLAGCGVVPYYLHVLDRVAGAAHFEVDEATAVGIVEELRAALPGYLVPRLVREIDGAPSKVPITPAG